ncbi:MAG TPA: alpha/beta fold hydrolase [Dehalococcoidales bacterium]|nr:alpha/beta fold hydrolase [Dehalococcoidales bacterium]
MIQEVNLRVDNLKIAGQLFLPDNGRGPFSAVILCHGVPSGAVDPTDGGYPLLAQTLASEGLAVYTFRFRGAGESEGNFDILGWLRDLQSAVQYMMTEGTPKSRLALVGFSAGAAVAICAAAADSRIAAVAACASPLDFSAISQAENPQYTVAYFRKIGIIRDENFPPSLPAWLDNFRRISALACVEKLSPRPLLLLHSKGDRVVPSACSQKLYLRAGEPKQIEIFEGEEHRLRKHPEAVKRLSVWLKETLKDG